MKLNTKRLLSMLLALAMILSLIPVIGLGAAAADGEVYKVTAPHVVKADKTKAAAGETVTITADETIEKVTAADAAGNDVAVTKKGNTFTFKMPASDVKLKTYYATTAISALQNLRVQGNPFIPIYDFNPDTEPHIWEDPDNPGEYRFYFLSSHDMNKTSYCSNNHVLYSCPVDDPFNWTYHGVIVGPDNTEHNDTLYAPDMCCVEDPTSPTGKYYYYYPCNQGGGRNTMVLRSSRPDGKDDPFTVINWADDSHNRTAGSIMTFDPSVFVDDDGKVYGYWGGYQSACHCAQLDETMYNAVPGTQNDDMFDDGVRGSKFGFFEASSMRKIGDTYVFVYSSSGKSGDPYSGDYHHLAYAYSDSPLGPFTYGGVIVDATAYGFYSGGNTHGSLIQLGDQWYVTYHRNVETDARQAMVSPVDITIEEDGTVKITEAEVSSEGFYINGLNPYAKVSLGTASYTKNCAMRPLYEHDVESLPIINTRSNTVFGVTYFDFNTEAPEGATSSLDVTLMPNGGSATMNIWVQSGDIPDSQKRNFNTANATKIGEIKITADMPKEMTTLSVDTPYVDQLDGKYGVFFTFSDVSGNNFAEFYDMQFTYSDHEHEFEASVVEPTCLEGGYTLGTCKICGKELKYDYTEALGHDWDEGTVTVAPTETSTGVLTITCKRCGETKTKKIPRIGSTVPEDIDFTNPDAASQFEIVNKNSAAIEDGAGLALVCTRPAFEDCKEQNSGDQATTPEDVVVYEAEGDWVATLEVDFSTNGASNGYYQFFGFYASEGDDFQNLVGVRGGDGAMQNFIREGGTILHQDEDGVNSAPGFANNGATYWLRIEKIGTTYTCFRSSDGENFTEMFAYEDTNIDADHIVIDAYTGMTTGYKFTLKSLKFEDAGAAPEIPVDRSKLDKAIEDAEKVEKDKYTDESVAALDEAVAAAKALPADAKQAEVDAAAAAVTAAMDGLEEKPVVPPVDKTELASLLEPAERLNEADYTPETFAAVKEALEAANAVYAKEDATQDEVDTAAKNLKDAVDALQPAAGKPDKRALAQAEADAGIYLNNPLEYTTESIAALQEALVAAAQVDHKEDATQDEVDAAVKAIRDAIEALEKKPADEFRFDDVKNEKSFYFKPVYWAYEAKPQITNGMTKTTFEPDSGCTRGQVVTFLWRAAGQPEPKNAETAFTDVGPKAFYAKAVAWAVENKITNGMTETTFEPNATCTRGQIVTFLWRFNNSPEPKSTETAFTDVGAKAFYAKAVAWAVDSGVTKGMTETTFAPNDTCTRGQVVTFLYRAVPQRADD